MTEKTEEQIAKEREAVEAMKNAKANMDKALARIETLTVALKFAYSDMATVKKWIAPDTYSYYSQKSRHNEIDEMLLKMQRVF